MLRIIHPNRWLIWTLFLILVAAFVLLYLIQLYFLTLDREVDQSLAGSINAWKNLRSDRLGISVNYPPSWQIEIDREEPYTIYISNPKDFSENISLSAVDPKLEKQIRNSLPTVREQEVVIDGRKGVWLIGADTRDTARSNVIFLENEETLYYIAGQAKMFERIVKSIKFKNR